MASYNYGKSEVCAWIREHFPKDSTILDVGACDGKWHDLLSEYTMDAVEIFLPNIVKHSLKLKYRNVYCLPAQQFVYDHYDLVIFGDVIEHMTVKDAIKTLNYAKVHSSDLIIGVPWLYEQGELYGNKYERHIQSDLTMQIFNKRYPGFEVLYDCQCAGYCYFHKGEKHERCK